MRILINGVYVGGNCPPFYSNLIRLGHDVKVVDVTFFKKSYGEFSSLIDEKDIIIPNYSLFDKICFKLFQRLKIAILTHFITKKLAKIVREYAPDIIINHQTSIRATIMNSVGFQPTVNYIYGSEIKGENIKSNLLKDALQFSKCTLTTTPEAKQIIVNQYPNFESKIINRYYSFIPKADLDKHFVKKEFNINSKITLFDNRTLRDTELTKIVVSAYAKLANNNKNNSFLLLKGFSGKNEAVEIARNIITENDVSENFQVVDTFISDVEYFKLLNKSDIVTSFLSADQFGEVIMHGMYFHKYLLLADLPQYATILGGNALFLKEITTNSIIEKYNELIKNYKNIQLDENSRAFVYNFDVENSFNKINNILIRVVNEYNKIS